MSELPPGFTLDRPITQDGGSIALPDGFVLDTPGHPAAGPGPSMLADMPRRLGTAAINVGLGLTKPFIGRPTVALTPGPDGKMSPQIMPAQPPEQIADTLKQQRDAAFNQTGVTEYQPSGFMDRVGQAGLEGLAGGVALGGPVINAAGSALSQVLAEKTPLPPVAAALLGQVGGSYATSKLSNALLRGTSVGIDPETRALAQVGIDNNIPVPVGKATDSRFIHAADSVMRSLPFSGYGKQDAKVQENFVRAVTKQMGEDSPKLTGNVIAQAYDRIGSVFEGVANRTKVALDPQLQNDLARISSLAADAGLDASQVTAINRRIDHIWDAGVKNNGTIPGDVYQTLTKRGEALDLLQGNRSTTSGQLAGQIRDALDEALARSASPADVAALKEARTQYKVLKTVEPLTLRADTPGVVMPSTGEINPAALLGRVQQQYKNAARADVGELPILDLARFGQRFVKEPNTSMTSERSNISNMMRAAPTVAAALLGGGVVAGGANIPTAAAVAGTTAALPRVVGSLLRSESLVRRQLGETPGFDWNRQALIAALRNEQLANAGANPLARAQ